MAEFSLPTGACDVDHGPMILAIMWSLLSLAMVVISLRIYLRWGLSYGISSDDYAIVASLLVGTIGVIFCTLFIQNGLGQHIYCLHPAQVSLGLKYSILGQIFNIIGIGLAKISLCLCILRIINRTKTSLAIALWVIIAFVSASHLSQVLLFIVQCRPMAAIWDPQRHPEAKCFSPHITYLAGYIGFGLDAFTDLICAVIPIFILHRLQINTRTKVALCCLMALGSLTAGCAIAKAVTLRGIFATDYTYAIWKPAICTIIEHLAGLSLISLSALKPLFVKVLDLSQRANSSRKSADGRYCHVQRRKSAVIGIGIGAQNAWGREGREESGSVGGKSEEAGIMKTMDFRFESEQVSRAEGDEWRGESNVVCVERGGGNEF